MKPKGIILSGGPASVLEPGAPLPPASLYQAGVPILGICYGEQAMAHQLGGKVEAGHHGEFGRAEVQITELSLSQMSSGWRGTTNRVMLSPDVGRLEIAVVTSDRVLPIARVT